MANGLKNRINKVTRANEEIDRLLGLPINQVRMELKHAFQDRALPEEQYNDMLDRLQKQGGISPKQMDIARRAAIERKVDVESDIELNSPEKQLLWAVVFARMMTTSKDPLARSTLWSQMQKTIGVNNEEISMARIIDRSLQNAETRFRWGQPGTWFYYNPRSNDVNIDLFYSLLLGFDHTRAVVGHELGHSELSNTYAKSMKELYEKVKIVVDPSTITRKDGKKERPRVKLSVEEYKQLMLDVAEWQLRFQLWHVTEDTAVNQYSANMQHLLNQNLGRSWNYIGVVLQGFGEIANGDDARGDAKISTKKPPVAGTPEWEKWAEKRKAKQEKANAKRDAYVDRAETPLTDEDLADIKAGKITPDIAEKMFDQMHSAVLMAFYEQNGLFRGTDENWERMRIIPRDVRRAVDLSGVPGANGKDAFEYLVDLSVGRLNPDPILRKIPMERERAKMFLAERAAGADFLKAPEDEASLLQYLDAQAQQGQLVKGFRSLKDSLPKPGDAVAESAEQKRVSTARRILSHPGLLGREAADKHQDPVAELLAQRKRLPEIIDGEARKVLASPRILGDAAATIAQPLEELFQQMARAVGIRNLQPEHADRLLITPPYATVQESYRAIVRHTSEQRGVLMEHIWDTYLKPYADVILEARKAKIEKDLEKKKEKNKEKKKQQKQQKGGGGQGEGQGGEGEGEGEGEEQGQPKPKPGEGEGEQNSGADAKPDISDDEDDEDNEGGQGEDSGIELDDDDYKDIGDLSSTPGEGRDNDNDQGDKQGDGFDQDDSPGAPGKKVGDYKDKQPISEGLTPEQREAARKAAEDARDARFGDPGGQQAVDLDVSQYAKGDWSKFYERIQELAPVIQHRERLYRKALAEQRQELHKQSVLKYSLLPRDGNITGRKELSRMLSKHFKHKTRQVRSLDDLAQFRDDEVIVVDTSIESVSLIDGSGSMNQVDLGNGVTAMDVALQSAVIDYMAARRAKVGGYIIMWGNSKPYVIATPDTPLEEVGIRLEGVRRGLNTSTALAPGLETSLEELGNFITDKSTISGTSLLTIYSDGEIQDSAHAARDLTILTKNAKNLSIEVAILAPENKAPPESPDDDEETKAAKLAAAESKKTDMEKVFDGVIKATGNRIVSILHGHDAHVIPLEVGRSALKRLRKFKVELEPDKDKRARFKKISRELKAGK